MKNINKKTLIIVLIVILGMGLVVYLATSVVPKALVTMSKASGYGKLSLTNSYILGEKILANSDGKDSCVINVFMLDTNNKGVPKTTVRMIGMDTIEPMSTVSDNNGKATFKVTSTKEGRFVLTAIVNGSELTKKINVTFRNQ
ncbi:MAG: Ig-like domain-containing protein [Candidatus Shapirobacteria bacterium]